MLHHSMGTTYPAIFEERKMKKAARLEREAQEAHQARIDDLKNQRKEQAIVNKENKMLKRQNTQFGGKSPRNMKEDATLLNNNKRNNQMLHHSMSKAYSSMYESQEGRRSPEERKARAKKYYAKEEVISYLMNEGFADNEVSAEVIATHMSDEWLNEIEEGYVDFERGKLPSGVSPAIKTQVSSDKKFHSIPAKDLSPDQLTVYRKADKQMAIASKASHADKNKIIDKSKKNAAIRLGSELRRRSSASGPSNRTYIQ